MHKKRIIALFLISILLMSSNSLCALAEEEIITEESVESTILNDVIAAIEEKHNVDIFANELTDIVITVGSERAVILSGNIVESDEDLDITKYCITGDAERCSYLLKSQKTIIISPYTEIGEINTMIILDDYGVELNGISAGMTLSQSGDIFISQASGLISLYLSINHSPFSFVDINGTANGDVRVMIKDGKIDVSGEIDDYTIRNTTIKNKSSEITVSGRENTRFVNESGKVVAYLDKNADGVYETKARG